MKRNSWKRLLAILGSASILTVSINPVRINAGGSDLPIVSADVAAGTESDGVVETSSTETSTDTAVQTSSGASSDSADDASNNTSVSTSENGTSSGSNGAESEGTDGNGEDGAAGIGDGKTSGSDGESGGSTEDTSDTGDTSISQSDPAASGSTETLEETENDDAKAIHVTYVSADDTMGSVDVSGEDGAVSEETGKMTFSGATAAANDGYEFVDWTVVEDGKTVEVSTEAKLVPVDVKEDTTYTANFREKNEKKTITITYAAGEGGKVTPGSESFEAGSETEVKLTGSTAEANEGYAFLGWVKGEDSGRDRTYVSSNAVYVPDADAITEDTTYTAVFEKKEEEKAAEHDLADHVDGLKVYYRTSSDETWTEAVITGDMPTEIPQTAEVKFEFILSRLTEAGDYTYEIPEFLTDASLEDGAFTSQDAEVSSTAEISTSANDTENSDSSDTSKLVLHVNKEDAAREVTGTQLTFTAKPNAEKLTAEADRARTLTFGDRTYTLSFASRLRVRMALAATTSGINIAEKITNSDGSTKSKYITGAQISWQNGSSWTAVSSATLIPLNVPFRITVDFTGIKTQDLLDSGCTLYYDIPNLLKDPYVANNKIMNGQEEIGTITASGTRITIALKQDYLESIIQRDGENSTIQDANFTFMATPDPDQVRENYTQTLEIGDVSTKLKFDPNYDSKNGTLNLTKSDPTYIEENGSSYLEYTLTIVNGDAAMPAVTVTDHFTKNANAVASYIGIPAVGTKLSLSSTASTEQPYETITKGGDAPTSGTVEYTAAPGQSDPGTILWTIGTMQPGEQRTLTYRVELSDEYAGVATAGNGVITNTATPASGENRRSAVTSTFTPRTSATVTKKAGTVQITDDAVIIPYTVTVTASSSNTWTLRNVKISDDFGVYDSNIGVSAVRNALLDAYGSWTDFYVYSGTSATGSHQIAERKDKEDSTLATPYFVVKTAKENPGFNLYIGDLGKGESKTVTFNVRLKKSVLDEAAGTSDGSVQLGNRAGAYSDDTEGAFMNQTLGAGYASSTLTTQKWDRKLQGTPISESIKQTVPENVYTYSGNAWTPGTSAGAKTIPADSIQYQVVVNEKGQWNVSSAIFQDTLSGNGEALHYAGYLRMDYYAGGLGENASFANDADAAAALSKLSPTKTVWFDVDDMTAFSFAPGRLSSDFGTGAYLLTYYAKPVNAESYSKVTTGNTFTLSGSVVGPGGTSKIIAGVSVSTSVVLSGSVDFSASKTAWYGNVQDTAVDGTTAVTFNRGSLYWIIAVKGSKIPVGTELRDTPDSNNTVYDVVNGVENVSIAGVYLSSVESAEDLTNTYTEFSQIKNNSAFEPVSDTLWTWSVSDGSGIFTFTRDMDLNGKQLYIIVRSEPKANVFANSSDARHTVTFSNSLSMRNSSNAQFTSVNQDSMKVTEKGTNLKEVADYGSYSKSTNGTGTWTNVNQVMSGNAPGNRILSSWTNAAGTTSELASGTYVDYRLIVNYAGNEEGTLRVEDVVPAGMEPVYVRYFWTNPNQSADTRPEMSPISSLPDGNWKEIGVKNGALNGGASGITKSAYAYYDASTGKVIFDVTNLHRDLTGAVDTMDIQVQIVMRVTDPDALLGKGATFVNTMQVYKTDGALVNTSTTSTDIKITDSIVKKMSDLTNSSLNFTITVNPRGEDLLTGSDNLTLVDEYSGNLVIDPSSIHVRKSGETSDVSFTVQMDSTNHTMTLVIPDSEKLVITYTAALQAALDTTASVSNSAHWYGYSSAYGKTVSKSFTVGAGGSVSFGSSPLIQITKVDSLNITTKLQGAVFDIYEAELGADGKTYEKTGDVIAEGTTDAEGIVTFGSGTGTNTTLKYNKIYCLAEKTAPAGYIKSTEPIYVGVFRSKKVGDKELYPKDWDQGNPTAADCWTSSDLEEWSNVSILYTNYIDKITWSNSRTKVRIDKTFWKEDGATKMDFPEGSYSFGLYYNGQQIQKLTITNSNGLLQYLLTANGKTTAETAPEFVGLNTNDTYEVYELDDTGNPVKDGRLVYTNGTQYTVAYQNSSSTITTTDAESQDFAISNTQFSIPVTGLPLSGSRGYVVGAALLAGVFTAYVLWMRRRRT